MDSSSDQPAGLIDRQINSEINQQIDGPEIKTAHSAMSETPAPEKTSAQPLPPVEVQPTKSDVVEQALPGGQLSEEFGIRSNSCIDVIQQSLDMALGSSGNLIPDNSVVSALNDLIAIVAQENIDELGNLLSPLSQLLTTAENSTLNQSETLLVQEAIIAATLSIDSLVSEKALPDLVPDVTDRLEAALAQRGEREQNSVEWSRSFNGFLNEADELQPRLFELFQRWRGTPFAASRLSGDINRLLHALKQSAEEVEESSISSLVHYLESSMVDLRDSDTRPSDAFFDLAIESIECLGEDIERLRNGESAIDRSDLIDQLKLAGATDSADTEDSMAQNTSDTGALYEGESVLEEEDNSAFFDEAFDDNNTLASPPAISEPANTESVIYESGTSAESVDWADHWVDRLDKINQCYSAINAQHSQLLELQSRLESVVAKAEPNTGIHVQLQSFVGELAHVNQRQTSSIAVMDKVLDGISASESNYLRTSLLQTLKDAAQSAGVQVRFEFEMQTAHPARDLTGQILEAVGPLLKSIVSETIQSRSARIEDDKPPVTTIAVQISRSGETLLIEVIDDAAGVTLYDDSYVNPWSQTARMRRFEARDDAEKRRENADAVSNLTNKAINIRPLLNLAATYGGTVTVQSDTLGAYYGVKLPQLSRSHAVLLVKVQQQVMAISATQVQRIASWDGDNALCISELIGVVAESGFTRMKSSNTLCVCCETPLGQHNVLVDEVLGRETLEFKSAGRLFPTSVPGYLGVSVSRSGQVVKLLDIDYWMSVASKRTS